MIVDGRYRARRLDDAQWVIEERMGRKPGNQRAGARWRIIGYITSLQGAERLVSPKILTCGVTGRKWQPAPAPSQRILDWLVSEIAAVATRTKSVRSRSKLPEESIIGQADGNRNNRK
jgi:hypothetical protein